MLTNLLIEAITILVEVQLMGLRKDYYFKFKDTQLIVAEHETKFWHVASSSLLPHQPSLFGLILINTNSFSCEWSFLEYFKEQLAWNWEWEQLE